VELILALALALAGLLWVLVSTAVRAWRDKRILLQRPADPATVRRRRLAMRQQALAGRTPAVDQP